MLELVLLQSGGTLIHVAGTWPSLGEERSWESGVEDPRDLGVADLDGNDRKDLVAWGLGKS